MERGKNPRRQITDCSRGQGFQPQSRSRNSSTTQRRFILHRLSTSSSSSEWELTPPPPARLPAKVTRVGAVPALPWLPDTRAGVSGREGAAPQRCSQNEPLRPTQQHDGPSQRLFPQQKSIWRGTEQPGSWRSEGQSKAWGSLGSRGGSHTAPSKARGILTAARAAEAAPRPPGMRDVDGMCAAQPLLTSFLAAMLMPAVSDGDRHKQSRLWWVAAAQWHQQLPHLCAARHKPGGADGA